MLAAHQLFGQGFEPRPVDLQPGMLAAAVVRGSGDALHRHHWRARDISVTVSTAATLIGSPLKKVLWNMS